MANCQLCGKKLSFFEGRGFVVESIQVHGVSYGDTYILCDECMKTVEAAQAGDTGAKNEARRLIDNMVQDARMRERFLSFLNIEKTPEEKEALERQAKEEAEQRLLREEQLRQYQEAEIGRMMSAIEQEKEQSLPVFELTGCRGRNMKVYTDRAVIVTDVTLGAVLTGNATDGEKTIFYHDVIGIQYKEPGLTIGYLQLETASGQMNNLASNQFSENTYTFLEGTDEMRRVKDYIVWQVSQYKKISFISAQ